MFTPNDFVNFESSWMFERGDITGGVTESHPYNSDWEFIDSLLYNRSPNKYVKDWHMYKVVMEDGRKICIAFKNHKTVEIGEFIDWRKDPALVCGYN